MPTRVRTSEVSETFTPQIRQELTRIFRLAYDQVVSAYDREAGWDAQLFGFAIYKYLVNGLAKWSVAAGDSVELLQATPAFRLKVGAFVVGHYGVPSSEGGIASNFPRNHNGATKIADLNQLELDLNLDFDVDAGVILAHQGNHVTGLDALYIAIPGSIVNERITSWHYTEPVWQRSSDPTVEFRLPIDGPAPAAIPEAPMRLRPQPATPRVAERNTDGQVK